MRLNVKLDEKGFACKVNFVFGFMILHWVRPLRDGIELHLKAYKQGLEVGDLICCGHCITAMHMSRIIMKDNIDAVLADQGRLPV